MNNNNQNSTGYRLDYAPLAVPSAVICGDRYRFTILSECMLRMEYAIDGKFNDSPTQTVICREFPLPEFQVNESSDKLELITAKLHLHYNKGPFHSSNLSVDVLDNNGEIEATWRFGEKTTDLGGTARTLDNIDGAVFLEQGLLSREGYTIIDDTNSAILKDDGFISANSFCGFDLYFLGYGHDYLRCLSDFFHLTGAPPMLPRYSLGNWWSRFYPYSEETYLALMDKFYEKEIPMAVAVIDMDWHLVDIPEKYGSGWTGYTWNRELFPNPHRFLMKLHEKGLHTTLNVHPADGVRAFEEAYLPMAKELDIDFENEEPIHFEATDQAFMESYFRHLHHPNEKIGVDFWWLDWQQGTHSGMSGVDPLWMLNHLHFLDSGRNGKLPLTFSRYAGIGSHRYPIGFSGDSIISWDSLKFQPYFTATASNIGYSWWSHDIGGHMGGKRDDELAVRWIQFGVFSPIMRLHSTANAFNGKEPWNYNAGAEKVITEFLKLRHRLIPYLYTMNYLTHNSGVPLVKPMYYLHDVPEAYETPNEYYFGDSMIVCPVTTKADNVTSLAKVSAWLPEGVFYDFFNGRIYQGGRNLTLYRSMDEIPVMIPVGSVIPMTDDIKSHITNPKTLDVLIFTGADGSFSLYEDDCSNLLCRAEAWTHFDYINGSDYEAMCLKIVSEGNTQAVIPTDRVYRLRFRGVSESQKIHITAGNKELDFEKIYNANLKELTVSFCGAMESTHEITVRVTTKEKMMRTDPVSDIYRIIHNAYISFDKKNVIYRIITDNKELDRIKDALYEAEIETGLYSAIMECLQEEILSA